MSFLSKIEAWFKKVFSDIQTDIAPVAVTITEALKTALDSGVLPAIAGLIPDVGPEVKAFLIANGDSILAKALAVELGIEGLPANATPEQIQTFANNVIAALAGSTTLAKSKIWTTVAVQLYTVLASVYKESPDGWPTFAEIVQAIEQAYQDYLTDLNTQTTT